MNKKIVRRQCA